VQRLGDQCLIHFGPRAVGRVDEVDAQLERSAQHSMGSGAVLGRTPHARAAQAHGKAHAIHRQIAELDGWLPQRGAVEDMR
jgi:hypothetical protein